MPWLMEHLNNKTYCEFKLLDGGIDGFVVVVASVSHLNVAVTKAKIVIMEISRDFKIVLNVNLRLQLDFQI